MKIVIGSAELSGLLNILGKAIPKDTDKIILNCVKIAADKETSEVTLTAFNGDLAISVNFITPVEQGGTVCVRADDLGSVIRAFKDPELIVSTFDPAPVKGKRKTKTAESSAPEIHLHLYSEAAKVKSKVGTMNPTIYPELEKTPAQYTLDLPAETLIRLFQRTSFLVDPTHPQPEFAGVGLTVTPEGVEVAGTEGNAIAVYTENIAAGFSVSSNIPKKSVDAFLSLLAKADPDQGVKLCFCGNTVRLETDLGFAFSRVLAKPNPVKLGMFPKQFTHELSFRQDELVSAMAPLAVLASEKNFQVLFEMEEGTILGIVGRSNAKKSGQCEIIPLSGNFPEQATRMLLRSDLLMLLVRGIATEKFVLGLTLPPGATDVKAPIVLRAIGDKGSHLMLLSAIDPATQRI